MMGIYKKGKPQTLKYLRFSAKIHEEK